MYHVIVGVNILITAFCLHLSCYSSNNRVDFNANDCINVSISCISIIREHIREHKKK